MVEELKEKKEEKKEGIIEEKNEEQAPKIEAPEKRKSITDVFLRGKPSKLLILLLQDKQWHISALARESNQSYIYATTLIKLFEASGMISINSNGKKRIVKLTEKGEKIARAVQELISLTTIA